MTSITNDLKIADPSETVPSNVTLHVLKIIREECQNILHKETNGKQARYVDEMSYGIVQAIDEKDIDYNREFSELKELVLDGLNEYLTEVAGSAENISKECETLIKDTDVVMTLGRSKTVEAFLKKAAKKGRKFRVLIAEGAPFCQVT